MKIAISGKGGVGKSTVAAALSLLMSEEGMTVLAVDADPDANLAAALGLSEDAQAKIVPISRQVELIEERTGAKVNQYGQIFKVNPEVSDIAENYATRINGIGLLVLGAVRKGGGGCACPENVLIRALVADMILNDRQALVMDMEAGIEHLGRATTSGVDEMMIVVEPGYRSIDGARNIIALAEQIGLKKIHLIANKITNSDDEKYIGDNLPDLEVIEYIPYSRELRDSDRPGVSVLDAIPSSLRSKFSRILERIV